MTLKTSVSPAGTFVFGIHKPSFTTRNLRENDFILNLGILPGKGPVVNYKNFPSGSVDAQTSDTVFEVPNAFPFKGATYILKRWADLISEAPENIRLPEPPQVSFSKAIRKTFENLNSTADMDTLFMNLPDPLRLAIATTGTDGEELVRLAKTCCKFVHDSKTGKPLGLQFCENAERRIIPEISDQELFEAIANNPHLPDDYKEVMVLRPGAQGDSEIVGEWCNNSHIFEYLRRDSYIPWGHYASNMAHDAIRYRLSDLTPADMTGMRHLYYQRTFVRLAEMLNIPNNDSKKTLSQNRLEQLRKQIFDTIGSKKNKLPLEFNATLWGWNFGYDFAPSRYRLHASHQQIHQQFALVPGRLPLNGGSANPMNSYACGDLIEDFIRQYQRLTGKPFFETYLSAIRTNQRMDGRKDRENSLIIHETDGVMVFVPKAQTSQWEIQLMTTEPVGNILEADSTTRSDLDFSILLVMKILAEMGVKMVTVIEYSKRLDSDMSDQRLLYSFLPRLPQSPGAFSEMQLRWILGHYPEDFAEACRKKL